MGVVAKNVVHESIIKREDLHSAESTEQSHKQYKKGINSAKKRQHYSLDQTKEVYIAAENVIHGSFVKREGSRCAETVTQKTGEVAIVAENMVHESIVNRENLRIIGITKQTQKQTTNNNNTLKQRISHHLNETEGMETLASYWVNESTVNRQDLRSPVTIQQTQKQSKNKCINVKRSICNNLTGTEKIDIVKGKLFDEPIVNNVNLCGIRIRE